MLDQEWIKNLAEAQFNGENWSFANPDDIRDIYKRKMANIITDLSLEAESAVQSFNLFSKRGHPIKLLKSPKGVAFLFAHCQISLVLDSQNHLQSDLLVKYAFQVQKFNLRQYLPYFDPFGELYWSSEGQQKLTYSHILMQVLQEIHEAYVRFNR